MSGNFSYANCVGCLSDGTANSIGPVLPLIVGVAVMTGLSALLMVAYRNLAAYEKMRGWLRFFGATPALAIEGALGLVPFATIGGAAYAITQAPAGTGAAIGKWAAIIVGAYAALVAWGVVVRKVRTRFKAHRAAITQRDAKQEVES